MLTITLSTYLKSIPKTTYNEAAKNNKDSDWREYDAAQKKQRIIKAKDKLLLNWEKGLFINGKEIYDATSDLYKYTLSAY